ncbi:hypothetical protein BKP45_08395 [Anaerobacillus alkalidiazotrophicus]|uniref:Histidine kinase domain-containing protein n=1 Tax=Anaerobacillus alkalidiazotrophicus TaxID=472963 RepID=A0A1S2M845_9BACI|nr:GHKL domain-containing protein [Anaerobacillus alkalidiazotrophicus]OIJ20804.1 hypothetical protein BKP45_08395 [Anaerobacillus alkalidiazotrophicus]
MKISYLVIILLFQILLIYHLISSMIAFNDSLEIYGIPVHLVFVVLLNLLSLIILGKLYKREEQRKIQSTESTHVEQFRSLVTSVRSDRHDMNNHLTVISGLLKIKNYEAASNYIKQMIGDISINNQILTIKSPILASMLFSKMNKFQKEDVLFKLTISNEDIVNHFSSTDLIRLLSNLLDNAYDAVLELPRNERKIYLDLYEVNHQSIISVKNTSDKKCIDENFFEAGYSTKGENRGFGLSIIQEITKKYNGTLVTKSTHNLIMFELVFAKGENKG